MPPKQPRASILVKGLALVAIPLVCELGFATTLLHLQDQALNVARQEARAHNLSDSVHQVIGNSLALTITVRGYSLARLNQSDADRQKIFDNLHKSLTRLKEQFAGDSHALAVIETSEKGTNRVEAAINEIRAALLANDLGISDRARALRHEIDVAGAMMVSPELLRLAQESDKNSELSELDKTQEQVGSMTINLILVSTALSIAMALYFSKEIAGRINEVTRNASKFSMGQSLGPPISGGDEIAELDEVFRTMTGLLESAMLKQRSVFDNTRDMICTLDRKLVVTTVNPACKLLLGKSEAELLGARIASCMSEADRSAFAQALYKMQEGGHPGQITAQMLNHAGEPIDTLCSAHWSEAEQSFFCVFHDISELKEAERLRQDVVAMVTHDIRSPLTAVINFEEMLETGSLGQLNEKGQRLLSLSRRSNITIQLLVNDLLDIEKIRAGQMALNRSRFAIAECIDKCAQSLAVWADQQQIKISVDSCNALVIADENRLGQVITNLISNGIKFSEKNTTVSVKARVNDRWLTVDVADQGAGIPADEMALIFERFRQGTSKKAHLGSGLGLSICKALVELHGGSISADSVPGKGSTFSFRIPYTPG